MKRHQELEFKIQVWLDTEIEMTKREASHLLFISFQALLLFRGLGGEMAGQLEALPSRRKGVGRVLRSLCMLKKKKKQRIGTLKSLLILFIA